MKKPFSLFVAMLGMLVFQVKSDAQWVQTNGPYGGKVYCFATIGTTLLRAPMVVAFFFRLTEQPLGPPSIVA